MAKKKTTQKKTRKSKLRKKTVATLTHDEAKRSNIPTAELQSVMDKGEQTPVRVAYDRQIQDRNRDLDPQLVWRGKDEQDWSDLVVHAPPLYIQEKVHPKVLIDDLIHRTQQQEKLAQAAQTLFADYYTDFNGLPDHARTAEFYQHEANWTNRMILGDSLQVMASLAEREGLRGKVQCIYLDPPYEIKFNSNFQWSTTSRDVKDGKSDHITREPEQVKAFRDTWRDGIHSYLTYLRDRLTVARDLLCESGSIFVQIGDENVHRVRAILDEVFGDANFVKIITIQKTGGLSQSLIPGTTDYVLWYARDSVHIKYRQLYRFKETGGDSLYAQIQIPDGTRRRMTPAERVSGQLPEGAEVFRYTSLESANPRFEFDCYGKIYNQRWKTNQTGLTRLVNADRVYSTGRTLQYQRFHNDFPVVFLTNNWTDTGSGSFLEPQVYVVQTVTKVLERCLLMATDPGDLVIDPTCGSGTTAYVAEQWGRRWITIDTSRVALALGRARIMGARYPYYYLADSPDGQLKEAEVTRTTPSQAPTHGDIRHGFVYERVPHITLKSIANNTEIDVIWERFQETLEPLRVALNQALNQNWEEWEIPRSRNEDWPKEVQEVHAQWWDNRIARQKEIDASIAAKADFEYLYDKPYDDNKNKVRVAGPFTVESISPHRVLAVDENDELITPRPRNPRPRKSPPQNSQESGGGQAGDDADFVQMVLEHLKTAGVQQAHKEDKITFTAITPWPGHFVCAQARYVEGDEEKGTEKRAGVFICIS